MPKWDSHYLVIIHLKEDCPVNFEGEIRNRVWYTTKEAPQFGLWVNVQNLAIPMTSINHVEISIEKDKDGE